MDSFNVETIAEDDKEEENVNVEDSDEEVFPTPVVENNKPKRK